MPALSPLQRFELWQGPPGAGGDPSRPGTSSLFRSDAERREAWRTYRAQRAADPKIGPPPTWADRRYATTKKGGHRGR